MKRFVGLWGLGAAVTLVVVLGLASSTFAAAPHNDSPDWLSTINYWRAAAGLSAVTDQPEWDQGILNHLNYLENTTLSDEPVQYQSAHTENPQSPFYTVSGATEAGYSDLALGGVYSDTEAIDSWLSGPFHAIGILRSDLTQVAFGIDPTRGFAGLDVIQGLDYSLLAPTSPILYPGQGSTTTLLTANNNEVPSPTQTCGWQGNTVGLPLIALLNQPPSASVSASLVGPNGVESTANGQLCVVDEYTYYSTDPVYGSDGLNILQYDNALVLIPEQPLTEGTYTADIQQEQPDQPDITWSFTAQVPVPVNTSAPYIDGLRTTGHSLWVVHGAWSGDPTSYTDQWLQCSRSAADCVPIAGATQGAYRLSSADAGSSFAVQETATNAGGPGDPVQSDVTGVVGAPPGSMQLSRATERDGEAYVKLTAKGPLVGRTAQVEVDFYVKRGGRRALRHTIRLRRTQEIGLGPPRFIPRTLLEPTVYMAVTTRVFSIGDIPYSQGDVAHTYRLPLNLL